MSSRRLPPSKGEGDSRDSLQARGTEPDDLGMPLQAPVSFETRGDQTIEHPPGRSSARELDAELTKAEQRPSEVIDGAVVPARKTVGEQWHHGPREDVAPSNAWDLIDRFFARLTWNTAGPITVVLIALGLTALFIFGGLGLAVHYVTGTSPWLSAAFAALAGGGASGARYAHLRRQKKLQRPDVGGNDNTAADKPPAS
jgi:hypothetical protein